MKAFSSLKVNMNLVFSMRESVKNQLLFKTEFKHGLVRHFHHSSCKTHNILSNANAEMRWRIFFVIMLRYGFAVAFLFISDLSALSRSILFSELNIQNLHRRLLIAQFYSVQSPYQVLP